MFVIVIVAIIILVIIIIINIIIIIVVIVTLLVQHAHVDSQITEHHSQHVRSIDWLSGAVTGALWALRALLIVASRLLAHKNTDAVEGASTVERHQSTGYMMIHPDHLG
jgi:energy-coupling factor transporter transmembrane protein EcfT